jgi:hypothetical protein
MRPASGAYKDGAATAWVSLNRGDISALDTKQVTISGTDGEECEEAC